MVPTSVAVYLLTLLTVFFCPLAGAVLHGFWKLEKPYWRSVNQDIYTAADAEWEAYKRNTGWVGD